MRLKRLMSVVLAVALVLSFAMSASAGTTLYVEENFKYADTAAWKANVTTSPTFAANSSDISLESLDAQRAAGNKNFATSWLWTSDGNTPNYIGQKWELAAANAKGNKYPLCTVTSNSAYMFVASEDWDGKTNTHERLVISFDVEGNPNQAKNYFWSNAITYTGNATTPVYRGSSLGTQENDGTVSTYKSFQSNELRTTAGEISRVAYIFEYDANLGKLVYKSSINGGEKLSSAFLSGNTQLDNTTKVAGMHFNYGSKAPYVSAFKMYTIDKADTFAVSAPIDGEDRASLDTSVVTLTFNQPVYEAGFEDAEITFTANGSDASDDIIVGDVVTGTVGGSYVSTVDVTLPALALSTDYEITITGVTNELGTALADNTISFSTPKPDITTSATITGAAVGSMSEASVAVSNNTVSTPKAVSVIYAVYTSAGKLVDVVYANDTVAAGTTATISAGIKLGTDAAKAKVMVWDGANLVNPFTGFTSATVAQ